MGLRHNPITYLILSNALLWGLPLAIIQMQSIVAEREDRIAEMTQARPTPIGDALMTLEPLIKPDPLAQLAPLDSRTEAAPIAKSTPPTGLPVLQSPGQAVDAMEIPVMPPDLLSARSPLCR